MSRTFLTFFKITTGNCNTAIGYTTGNDNIAVGYTTDNCNIAIGYTIGNDNTAIGILIITIFLDLYALYCVNSGPLLIESQSQ